MATRKHKRTARRKQRHTASATLRVPALAKADASLTLEIAADGEKLGEMLLGRGGVTWWGRHRKIKKHISWSRFAEVMDGLAYAK